ncbi:MAG: DUF1700 domain-containing protein [Candidatus Izemoplasmatales bacterium]|nr:DUF1700 domain-containing protein [bacterium]MDZ4196713.1 DUF1700 domain-containing protein [Candidatus Izemoplasmatales bacterium]
MKQQYLDKMRTYLEEREFGRSEIEDIIQDYSQMMDDGVTDGKTIEEVIEKLGSPKDAVKALTQEKIIRHDGVINQKQSSHKIVALMPFISTILFFAIGFGFERWHPTWMVFFLIPITGILSSGFRRRRHRHLLTSLSPFLATTAFLLIGFLSGYWHPAWLVFLLIPMLGIIESNFKSCLHKITSLSPFLSVIAFVFLGMAGLWNPGWLVFLSIPMLGLLHSKSLTKIILSELSFLIAIGLYLYIGYQYQMWGLAASAFLIPVIYGILSGEVKISLWKGGWLEKLTLILALIVYIGVGYLTQTTWPWLWVVFLAVPVVAIFKNSPKSTWMVATSPFVALTIFIVVGFLFQAFHIVWLAFFWIPIAGILKK